jgi:hypothetical protein
MKKSKLLGKAAQNLLRSMDEVREVRFKIACYACGKEDEIVTGDDDPPTQTVNTLGGAAQAFYQEGWRHGVSETWQSIGIHCPRCWRNRNKPEEQHT